MIKKSLFIALIGWVTAIPASTDIKKGQRSYLKKCKRCHGNGTKAASMKTQEAWNGLLNMMQN